MSWFKEVPLRKKDKIVRMAYFLGKEIAALPTCLGSLFQNIHRFHGLENKVQTCLMFVVKSI